VITIKADRSVCQGYGNCVLADPHLFDVDDEGLVVLSSQTVGQKVSRRPSGPPTTARAKRSPSSRTTDRGRLKGALS